MEKLVSRVPELELFSLNSQSLMKDLTRAYHGLADLHEYVNIDLKELSEGIINDVVKNITYNSTTKLSINDLLQIAIEARLVGYYEGSVNWLQAALTKAKRENKSQKLIKYIK